MANRILFVHQNFPGQFPHIADACVKAGYKVAAIGGPSAKGRPGIDVRRWALNRGTTPGIFNHAIRAEADLMRAAAAAEAAMKLKADGFTPDVIVGHPGWGETLQLGEVFPCVPQVMFGEFYYRSHGADTNFDPEFENQSMDGDMRIHAKNLGLALAYASAETIVCPTPFQALGMPPGVASRIKVFHEGVDMDRSHKKAGARLKVGPGQTLDGSRPVITFINRNYERLRGFHIFMRALPELLQKIPEAHVVIIGNDSSGGYGGQLPNGQTWKSRMLAEVGSGLDLSRVHFVGRLSHSDMIEALSISWAHVYYTYPFILSWSLVEAMACECLIIGSDTAPVRDAIINGHNGILNEFFDSEALSRAMIDACERPREFDSLRLKAKETAYALFDRHTVGVPQWMQVIEAALKTNPA